MRRVRNLWVLILMLFASSLQSNDLSFVIKPMLDAIVPQIEVTLEFSADDQGVVRLSYLNNAWGEKDLYNSLADIQVVDSEAKVFRAPNQDQIVIWATPFEKLKVRYILRQDFRGEARLEYYYRPIINNSYFHLFGHRLFLLPQHLFKDKQSEKVVINWDNGDYLVQHNFGTKASGTYDLTRNELLESVIVGGDFRRNSIEINGIQLLLLTRGEWKNFADDELLAKIESIINVQRTFWSDYSDDIYTVTLLPLESESGIQMGGTGLAKGFASYCSNSKRSSIDNLTGLYYHEIMHHWIGGKIRNATDYKELWFSEGFTEYFAHLLMQEEGEITAEQLINEIELARQTLRGRSKVNVNNDAIRLNSETEKLPYLRGFVYADYLDKRLQKKRGICLRDVMLRILEDSEQQVFSNDYFQDLLDSYLGSNDVKKFEKFILEGSKIP